MGRGTLGGGPVRVRGPSGRSGTDRWTLGEVLEWSGDPQGRPRPVCRPSERSLGPSGRSGTGHGTLGEVQYGSGDPRGTLGGFGTGRGTLTEVVDVF